MRRWESHHSRRTVLAGIPLVVAGCLAPRVDIPGEWHQPDQGHVWTGYTPPTDETRAELWARRDEPVRFGTEIHNAAGADLAQSAIEGEITNQVNDYRSDASLPVLVVHNRLRSVARAHAKDMAERVYYGHEDPAGYGPIERVIDAGFWTFEVVPRENIGEVQTEKRPISGDDWSSPRVPRHRTPTDVATSFMSAQLDSPPHRNIILGDFHLIGVGCYQRASRFYEGHSIFVTMLFCRVFDEQVQRWIADRREQRSDV